MGWGIFLALLLACPALAAPAPFLSRQADIGEPGQYAGTWNGMPCRLALGADKSMRLEIDDDACGPLAVGYWDVRGGFLLGWSLDGKSWAMEFPLRPARAGTWIGREWVPAGDGIRETPVVLSLRRLR